MPGQTQTAAAVRRALGEFADPEKAAFYPRFFRSGPGEYGEGDRFLGVTVPNQRKVARSHRALPFREVAKLLDDPLHECRLTGLLILVLKFEKADEETRQKIVDFYLKRLDRVNNWDLVDATAHKILGPWLVDRERDLLYELAESDHLWRQRVALIACLHLIKLGDFTDILALSESMLDHPHDLIHKASGWMLREVGKQDRKTLERFLDRFASRMPRTMLRYAIERLPKTRRTHYMNRR